MAVRDTPIPDFNESDAEDEPQDSIDLDDVGASFEDESEDDSKAEEAADDSDEDEDDETDDFDEDESESEDEAEGKEEAEPEGEDEPKVPEPSAEEKQKAFNKEQAEKRLQAKAEREAGIKQTQDEYLAAADPDDPRDLAVRQLQIDAYNNKVDANTNKLTNGYEKAIADFPILSDQSPEVQRELSEAIDAFQALHVSIDKYGNPIDVRADLYAHLQRKADSIAALSGRGARQQTQNKTKERSKAITAPSRAPREPKKDPDIDAFDEEAARW